MTTIQVELPDEQAETLRAKLSAKGLSLEEWFQRMAELEAATPTPLSPHEAVDRILELQKHVRPDPEGWTVKDYINHGRP